MHDVVLRHVANGAAQRIVNGVQIFAVDPNLAGRGGQVAVQRQEQGRLAGAGRTHQRDQVAGQRLEADVVEQGLHLARVVPIPNLHQEVPRLDLVQRTPGPLGGVLHDHRDLLRLYLYQQRHGADEDLLAVLDGYLLPWRNPLAAHVGAIRAAAVLEVELPTDLVKQRVLARNLRVLDLDVVVRRAADGLVCGLPSAAQRDLANDRLVLRARCRGGGGCTLTLCCCCGLAAAGKGLGQLEHQVHRQRYRAQGEQSIGVYGLRLLWGESAPPEPGPTGGCVIDHRERVQRDGRVVSGHVRVLDDDVRLVGFATKSELSRNGSEATLVHQHHHDCGMRERYCGLTDDELRAKIERDRRAGCDGRTVGLGRSRAGIDEDELPAALMDDARVLRCHAGTAETDVTTLGRADGDGLLAEAGDHRIFCSHASNKPTRSREWRSVRRGGVWRCVRCCIELFRGLRRVYGGVHRLAGI